MPSAAPAGTGLFLKRWLRQPFAMGAVMPSGRLLAEAMARATLAAMVNHPGHVIELGAGTGEVTKALLVAGIEPKRLALVERDPELVAHDVAQGYVSRDAARDAYRVALTADGRVDAEATARLRRDGPNVLRERSSLSRLGVLLSQLESPLLLVLLGVLQFGLIFNSYVTVSNAVREAAREGSIYRYSQAVCNGGGGGGGNGGGNQSCRDANDAARMARMLTVFRSSLGMLSTAAPQFTDADLTVTYEIPSGAVDADTRAGDRLVLRATYHQDLLVPFIAARLAGGTVTAYGAKAIPEGGWHALLGVLQSQTQYAQAILPQNSNRVSGTEARVKYVTTAGSALSLLRWTQGDYLNRVLDAATASDNAFHRNDTELRLDWNVSGTSAVLGRIG